ncbi:TspO/MBR family protein [Aquimarina sp. 2201CG5-10]|uniref:TspO/MBR family protein n=1 Tax=Aquimarina callyspongiae TaxID=3098150 RepID=UPI002AB58016|nr:TspO/MBR family protein [Aquimarina sp. 2201CG5-10]MDY8134788.1 TspO/MBR family protein [Aquimarina sp. 2201CG5-10]
MKKKFIRIVIAVFLCLLIGFLSSIATQKSIDTWYPTLNKPFFTPPNWVFAPVWIIMYIMMGISAGIVWSRGFYHKWVKTALYHFGFQLLLNAAWSIFFFGLQNPLIALLDIIALFILLLFTIKWFKVVNSTAAYLLIPYVIWVAFATALNFGIWQLN